MTSAHVLLQFFFLMYWVTFSFLREVKGTRFVFPPTNKNRLVNEDNIKGIVAQYNCCKRGMFVETDFNKTAVSYCDQFGSCKESCVEIEMVVLSFHSRHD